MGDRQHALEYAREKGLKSVLLRREKDNKYDPNAIAVLIMSDMGRIRVGYIPNRAKCLLCDPQQKGHGQPSYKVSPSYLCPECGGRMDPGTADKIAHYFDERENPNESITGRIISVTGGGDGKPTKGLVIEVTIEDTDTEWWSGR
jgi:hypothetical protein